MYIYIYISLCTYTSEFSIVFWGASRFSWLGAQNHPPTTDYQLQSGWGPRCIPKTGFKHHWWFQTYLILSVWWLQNVSNIIDFSWNMINIHWLMLFFDVFQGVFQPPDVGMVPEKLGINPATFLRCGNDEIMTGSFSGVSATNETWGWVQICCHTRNRSSWTSYFRVPIPKIILEYIIYIPNKYIKYTKIYFRFLTFPFFFSSKYSIRSRFRPIDQGQCLCCTLQGVLRWLPWVLPSRWMRPCRAERIETEEWKENASWSCKHTSLSLSTHIYICVNQ